MADQWQGVSQDVINSQPREYWLTAEGLGALGHSREVRNPEVKQALLKIEEFLVTTKKQPHFNSWSELHQALEALRPYLLTINTQRMEKDVRKAFLDIRVRTDYSYVRQLTVSSNNEPGTEQNQEIQVEADFFGKDDEYMGLKIYNNTGKPKQFTYQTSGVPRGEQVLVIPTFAELESF